MADLLPEPSFPVPALRNMLGGEPRAWSHLGGGRNSRVYRVVGPAGEVVALKHYFQHSEDPRDRLGVEFKALQFMREQGLRCIPQPLKADSEGSLALFEFIEGQRVDSPSPAHMEEASHFLQELQRLSKTPGAASLPRASEAQFSIRGITQNIQQRLDRYLEWASRPGANEELKSFLLKELNTAWEAIFADCMTRCEISGISFNDELRLPERTLSPSDFGFHNAILRNGEIVFLDFEYFGWDDPSKLVTDLLLHPGMDLSMELRRSFAKGMLSTFVHIPELQVRIELVFPLFGIKWCLILLNEFIQGNMERRSFADPGIVPAIERQARQLAKARCKLKQTLDEHADFPYFKDDL